MTTTPTPVEQPEQSSAAAAFPVGLNDLPHRKIGKIEQRLGPETYRILRGIFRNPLSVIGVILIGVFVLIALLAPVIAPPKSVNNPFMIPRDGFSPTPKEPGTVWKTNPPPLPFYWTALTGKDTWIHLFGTASGQYDIFYGVIWGTRTALKVGIIIEFFCLMMGIFVGSIAAFYGGKLDMLLMRLTEIFQAFPYFLAAMTLSAILTPAIGKSLIPAIIALVSFGWMGYARLIRGDILSVREREYVMAARVVGVKDNRILTRHIIPNAIYPTLVVASLDIGTIVVSFAVLSFLGIGTEVGYADWGQIISFARNWIPQLAKYWYIVVYPGVALILFVLGWNLVGDAMRDIMDPRMRGSGQGE